MIDMDAVYGIPGKHPVASFQFPALLATLLAGGLSLLGSKVAVLEVFYTISSLLGILVSAGLYSFSFLFEFPSYKCPSVKNSCSF
jgi:allantoin permease